MLMAYVQPAIPKPFVNPLKGLPWLALAVLSLFMTAFGAFVFYFAELPLDADFQSKSVNPVAVKLIAPPKPEEKKKIEKALEKIKKDVKKPEVAKKVEKQEPPKAIPQETKKALKSIEKLAAAGPAMKDLLAAVDKLGSGPGAKNAKNDFKLSGLIGKAPIANAGIGTFGLGGGGAGGMGIKGLELLRGKGGGGIGALGAGNIGKGSVGRHGHARLDSQHRRAGHHRQGSGGQGHQLAPARGLELLRARAAQDARPRRQDRPRVADHHHRQRRLREDQVVYDAERGGRELHPHLAQDVAFPPGQGRGRRHHLSVHVQQRRILSLRFLGRC